jgi:hypothetical protein
VRERQQLLHGARKGNTRPQELAEFVIEDGFVGEAHSWGTSAKRSVASMRELRSDREAKDKKDAKDSKDSKDAGRRRV